VFTALIAVAAGLAVPSGYPARGGAAVALAAPANQEAPSELPESLSREALLERYAAAVVELKSATTCAAKEVALNKLIAVERNWVLLGYGESGLDPESFYPEALTFCYEEYFAKCHELKDPAFGVAMRGIERTAHVLGKGTLLDASKIDRCLTFELRLEGRFDLRNSEHVWMTHSRASVPVEFDGLQYTGQAPLESIGFTYTAPVPTKNTRVEPGTLAVTSMASDFSYVAGTLSSGQALDLQLGLQLASPQIEHWVMALGPGMDLPRVGLFWGLGFSELHRDEEVWPANWLLQGFQHVGGSVYARKTYVRSGSALGLAPVDEQTAVELWHTPKA